jgi:hypothetical protein
MSRISLRYAVLALALMLSLSALAKERSESVTLYHDATLNGASLPAGQYVVKYDVEGANAQVKFMQGKKEVASANGQVKSLGKKSPSNQIVIDTENNGRNISEIDFNGKDTGITFASAASSVGK